jgi:hypothetical protein
MNSFKLTHGLNIYSRFNSFWNSQINKPQQNSVFWYTLKKKKKRKKKKFFNKTWCE